MNNASLPERRVQALHRFLPQRAVLAAMPRRRWRHLSLAPISQDARVPQIDATVPVKPIQTPDNVIGFAGAWHTRTARPPRALAPRPQRTHRPKPRFFNALEWLGPSRHCLT